MEDKSSHHVGRTAPFVPMPATKRKKTIRERMTKKHKHVKKNIYIETIGCVARMSIEVSGFDWEK